jgi:hypothetical protein
MPYRVIQWSTGNVGLYSLRQVIDHPELELVGLWAHSPSKVGKDAGTLCDRPATGVKATNDAAALLAMDADCVVYTATADLRPFEAIEEIAGILAAGKNVVSSSVVPLVHPKSFFPEIVERLEDACRKGRSSFFTSGIDPGFANDLLPLVLSGLAGTWEEIRIQEIINYATYDQPQVLFETMGFGQPLEAEPLLLTPGTLAFAWGGTIRLLAEGLGLELEEIRQTYEKRPAVKPVRIGARTVEPGTMGALRFEVQGIVGGKPAVVVDHVTRIDDECAPDWPYPPERSMGCHQVVLEGDPDATLTLTASDADGDRNVGGIALSAGRLVHAIPDLVAAPARIVTALDLPLVHGRVGR